MVRLQELYGNAVKTELVLAEGKAAFPLEFLPRSHYPPAPLFFIFFVIRTDPFSLLLVFLLFQHPEEQRIMQDPKVLRELLPPAQRLPPPASPGF